MNGDTGRSESLRRALDMLHSIGRERSTTVSPVPGGQALLNADFPAAHDLNRLLISADCLPTDVADAADDVLGSAGLDHRLIEVPDAALGESLADGLRARGYESSQTLVMAATRPAARSVPTREVVQLGLEERIGAAHASWRRLQPDWDETTLTQLGRRITTMLPAAHTTFLGARDAAGTVAARADLYVRDGVAQVDEVLTDPGRRGQGLASLLVAHAVERARAHGAEHVFLLTDADDWPQHLYRRLGFTDIGTTMEFEKTAEQPSEQAG